MTILNTKLATATAIVVALGAPAFADGHVLDLGTARLDVALDKNGDGEVTDDEIIDGNMAFFDADGSGAINAVERANAEEALRMGSTVEMPTAPEMVDQGIMIDLDVGAARLDTANDQNGDGEVSDDEIIRANMELFDTDGSGAIDATERNAAEEALRTGSLATVDAVTDGGSEGRMIADFDVGSARLDTALDTNGDGEVSDDEIIDGNMAFFDTDNSGAIDAAERNVAEQSLKNN